MKRDIDLARQLLLDIEARGADCSVSVLRTAADHEAEERVRYHLRLLIDAGFLKEIDRTANGVPCLRLTDSGHELIELTRNEGRWREAKWACHERTGGLAITVIRSILVQWATAPQPRRLRRRYRPSLDSLVVERPARPYTTHPAAEYDAYPYVPYAGPYAEDDLALTAEELAAEEQVRYVRVRPPRRNGWRPRHGGLNGGLNGDVADAAFDASLPEYLI